MYEKREVCELLDKLTLEMLDLIEQEVSCKVNIEKRINEGAQLPSESSPEFNALVTAQQVNDDFLGRKISALKHKTDRRLGYVDPLRWFGVLVPRSLVYARERFQKSLDLIVEGTNIQRELDSIICYVTKLKSIKCSM